MATAKKPAAKVAPKKVVAPPSAPPAKPVGRVQIAPSDKDPTANAARNATKVVEGDAAAKSGKDIVRVNCPNEFRLTLDDHSQVHYLAGTARMPRAHAEAWYAINNGVEITE